ncbi:hypothetical protein [Pseudonocardia acidicola]|uniref:hypothetical protein n=1 Tax=Pseudonocardia acidicola TaxID=2724939 RepID=UPI001B7CF36F|nr:hypothetical protein [Pseudonocardia acidicola]
MRMPVRRRDGTSDAAAAPTAGRPRTLGHARMAGWSGIGFAVLFTVGLVLVKQAPGLAAPDADYAAFYRDGRQGTLVILGLYVVPFAGIACIWHMIATRTLIQVLRPRSWSQIPHWLHLASGVVFVCMLFSGSAAVGAVALLTRFSNAPPPPPDVARALAAAGYAMVFVYGVRAAGMYMITTTGMARAAGMLPRRVALLSYLVAAFLLLSTTFHPAILLVFPAWVVSMSVALLVHRPRGVTS